MIWTSLHPCLALLFTCGPTGPRALPDELTFGPQNGTTLTTSVRFFGEGATSESFWVRDGVRTEADFREEWGVACEVVLTDEYQVVQGGRPALFKRSFDVLNARRSSAQSGEQAQMQGAETTTYFSALIAETVQYTWDPRGKEYVSDLLHSSMGDWVVDLAWEGSETDLSFVSLLPGTPVFVGDSWEFDPFVFGMLLVDPHLEFGFEAEEEVVGDGQDYAVRPWSRPTAVSPPGLLEGDDDRATWLTGVARATYSGTRNMRGRQLAVLDLDLALTAEFDSQWEDEGSGAFVNRNELRRLGVKGEALWDLAGRHLFAVDLAGSEGKQILERYVFEDGSQGLDSVDSYEGPVRLEVEIGRW